MMSSRSIGASMFASLFACVLCYSQVQGQQSDVDPSRQLIDHVQIASEDIVSALGKVAKLSQVAIGFEAPDFPYEREQVTLEVSGATLRQVLDEIKQTKPGYEWKVKGDVISFYPTGGVDPIVDGILETRVAFFHLGQGIDFVKAGQQIVGTPEVESKLKTLGVEPLHFSTSAFPSKIVNPNRDIELRNVNVRNVLDEIVRQSPARFWAIIRWGEEGKVITIVF